MIYFQPPKAANPKKSPTGAKPLRNLCRGQSPPNAYAFVVAHKNNFCVGRGDLTPPRVSHRVSFHVPAPQRMLEVVCSEIEGASSGGLWAARPTQRTKQ